MIFFQVSLNFDPLKEVLKMRCRIYWGYSEENASDNEDFHSTIFRPFAFEPEQKKRVVMRAMRKKLNIFTLQLPVYYQGRMQRFWKGKTLYVGHHGWPAKKSLGSDGLKRPK